jgi:citrate synthase
MKTWLSRDEALELLKVRPQTLYAYVSRGQIGMRPDPDDPRRSLYRAADINGLTRRREWGKPPAAIAASTIAWGEPIITTAISTVLRGRLYYRGRDVAELAETATLEEAAALLWNSPGLVRFRFNGQRPQGRGPARSRAFVALAAAAAAGEPTRAALDRPAGTSTVCRNRSCRGARRFSGERCAHSF